MNDLARRPQGRLTARQSLGRAAARKTGEDEAFFALDPLAADLHKYHQDALCHARDLAVLRGADDPLAEVASDMADSAGSALQTRLIELRADAALCRAAARLQRRMDRLAEQERQLQSARFRARLQIFYLQQILSYKEEQAQERREQSLILFLFWMLMLALQRAQDRLRLVSDFAMACMPDNRTTAA